MSEKEIVNARITGTSLGVMDKGIFSFYIYLEWPGAGVGFGGYILESSDEKKQSLSIDLLKEIMQVVGVDRWEDLEGKLVRLDTNGIGRAPSALGNILEDKWIYVESWFEDRKKDLATESRPDTPQIEQKDIFSWINSKGVKYYLNRKDVSLRGDKKVTIYYFSNDRRDTGITDLPAGYSVNENPRNGFLTVKAPSASADGDNDHDDEDDDDY